MLVRAYLALCLLLGALTGAAAQPSSLYAPMAPTYAQVGPGTQWTGGAAGGAEVSLLGTGLGTPTISCPYPGTSWRISGGGTFSTALMPGAITPKVVFGAGSVARTITNILASASSARWSGSVTVTCVTVGASGTIRATGLVTYATGEATEGAASLNADGAAITLDNRGALPIDVRVTMASQSAANAFRLDVLTVERLF